MLPYHPRLVGLFSTSESYEVAIFLGVQSHLAGLISFSLDYLDKPVSMTGADDSGHCDCALWLALAVQD